MVAGLGDRYLVPSFLDNAPRVKRKGAVFMRRPFFLAKIILDIDLLDNIRQPMGL